MILMADGFDNIDNWTQIRDSHNWKNVLSSELSLSPRAGRNGNPGTKERSLFVSGTYTYHLMHRLPTIAGNVWFIQFAVRPCAHDYSSKVSVYIEDTRVFYFRSQASVNKGLFKLGSSEIYEDELFAYEWAHYEIRFEMGALGRVTIKRDGEQVYDEVRNTLAGFPIEQKPAVLALSSNYGGATTNPEYVSCFDDIIFWDDSGPVCNDWLGEQEVIMLKPTGTVSADSGGSHENINENDNDALTYNELTAKGDTDLFTYEPLPERATAVTSLGIVNQCVKKGGFGSGLIHRLGNHDSSASPRDHYIQTRAYTDVLMVDSNDGVNPWTIAEANAIHAGYEAK